MLHWTVHVNGDPKGCCANAAVQHEVFAFVRFCYRPMNIYYGGYTKIDAHVFNTESLRWSKLTTVTTKTGSGVLEGHMRQTPGHTAVLIEYIVYIWGGPRPHSNVLYGFDVDTHGWSKPTVSGTVPEGRWNHSACVLGNIMYIHGGACEQTGCTNDTYKLDTATMAWSLINNGGTPPPASYWHSATIIGRKMFVFGGWEKQCFCPSPNDYIRVFDTETNCWLNTPRRLPGKFGQHAAFAYNGELYITGDKSQGTIPRICCDMWKFNPKAFSWKEVEPKGEGPGAVLWKSCCVAGERIILRGGTTRNHRQQILDMSPSLKTLCILAVIGHGLEQSQLPHNIRWELAAVTSRVP